jgi:hypothetical protein
MPFYSPNEHATIPRLFAAISVGLSEKEHVYRLDGAVT